jgi:hypothetical protein
MSEYFDAIDAVNEARSHEEKPEPPTDHEMQQLLEKYG